MTQYQPNWERTVILNALSSASLVLGLVATCVVQSSSAKSWLAMYSGLAFFFWFLGVAITTVSVSSSLRIEDGEMMFTRFGKVLDRKPVHDLIEVVEERHFFPGRLTFSDGTIKRVSGIALGKSVDLYQVLVHLNPSIIIRKHESAT